MKNEKPQSIYLLIILLFSLVIILSYWGYFAFTILVQIPSWEGELSLDTVSIFYWIFFLGSFVWFGSSALFLFLIYGIIKEKRWSWTMIYILTTFGIIVFIIMLIGFFVVTFLFKTLFSILGLSTVIIGLLLLIYSVYLITRVKVKQYFLNKR